MHVELSPYQAKHVAIEVIRKHFGIPPGTTIRGHSLVSNEVCNCGASSHIETKILRRATVREKAAMEVLKSLKQLLD